jgi:hypothetical protein
VLRGDYVPVPSHCRPCRQCKNHGNTKNSEFHNALPSFGRIDIRCTISVGSMLAIAFQPTAGNVAARQDLHVDGARLDLASPSIQTRCRHQSSSPVAALATSRWKSEFQMVGPPSKITMPARSRRPAWAVWRSSQSLHGGIRWEAGRPRQFSPASSA